jgi:hypothetical protein
MEDVMGDVGKRLAVCGKVEVREVVDNFAVAESDWPELKSTLITDMTREIHHFVCAECANCQHMKPRTEEFQDPANMQTKLVLQVVCGKVTAHTGSSECPDGFDVHRRGWKSGVETADMTGFGDHMTLQVVTGHTYSQKSPDPLTMNHLTLDQRAQQRDELMMSIERGITPGRYDRDIRTTVFELPGRQVTFHENGGVTGSTTRGKPEPTRPTINWPKDGHQWPTRQHNPNEFAEEYTATFGMPTEKPKDLPSSPDAGTW